MLDDDVQEHDGDQRTAPGGELAPALTTPAPLLRHEKRRDAERRERRQQVVAHDHRETGDQAPDDRLPPAAFENQCNREQRERERGACSQKSAP